MTINDKHFTEGIDYNYVSELSDLELEIPPNFFFAFMDRFDLTSQLEFFNQVIGWTYVSPKGKTAFIFKD